MITITLPPELEQVVTEQAQQQGTTPELLALDKFRGLFQPAPETQEPPVERCMADFFSEFIGSIHSSEIVPGGANLSENTGRKFKDIMFKR
jgi:hypothetical protein